jgi:PAS domain S-box-containing protein
LSATEDISELLIRSVLDYAIYMLDPTGRVVSWNPGAERIKGYTAAEIIGQHFSRFYTEEERAAGVPETALLVATETGRFTAESWRVRKDGTRFWAMVVIDPILRDGELVGFAKITRDMTEQHDAHLAMQESERRFRLLVQGVTDYAIYMLDRDGRVVKWNSGATRIKGYSEPEVLGKHMSLFYTPEDRETGKPWQALAQAARKGRYESEGWRVRKDGGRFWANAIIDAIYDDHGELIGFAKITRDLTERREAQVQLERSQEQLFQSQKLEAIGQLTGGLAHDFNNMLAGIVGSLELLRTRIAQGRVGDLERYITTAHGAATRAAALTHRLLAFARRQPLDPKPTNPNKLIANMEDLLQRTMGPGIIIETVFASGIWATLCDPNQLENAILNVCINARDAMPDGGRLLIETANVQLDEPAVRERDKQAVHYVVVAVTDTGTGMSPAVLARAFEPFYTTKALGQGTGLGLSMVYGFARQSNGQVQLHSTVGSGTTVRICLPRHEGRSGEQDEATEPTTARAEQVGKGRTVLIVDDEPTIRMLVTDVVEELGYSAIEAADGVSGLKVLQSNVPIDLLITDIGLPGGINGRQMADAARMVRPGLRILFMTGYAENVIGDGKSEPGIQLLAKPFAIDTLTARISAIIAKG